MHFEIYDGVQQRFDELTHGDAVPFSWSKLVLLLGQMGFEQQHLDAFSALFYYQGDAHYPLPIYAPYQDETHEWNNESVAIVMKHCHAIIARYVSNQSATACWAETAQEAW